MKYLLSRVLLFLLLLNILFPLNAIAVEEDAIKYGANESFVILIPSGFTFDISNEYITEVIAKNVLISSGKTLNISISSNNYDNKWVAKDLVSGKEFIVYKIGKDEKYTINNNDVILSVNSGDKYDGEVSQPLYFKLVETSTAGSYHDVLTFTTNVE